MQIHTETTINGTTKAADAYDEIDWRAELESRWQALGRKLFVTEPERPPALRDVLNESSRLAVVWALAQAKGNFTHAAGWLGTSRKVIRRNFLGWRRVNPSLIPMPSAVYLRWLEIHGGKRP